MGSRYLIALPLNVTAFKEIPRLNDAQRNRTTGRDVVCHNLQF